MESVCVKPSTESSRPPPPPSKADLATLQNKLLAEGGLVAKEESDILTQLANTSDDDPVSVNNLLEDDNNQTLNNLQGRLNGLVTGPPPPQLNALADLEKLQDALSGESSVQDDSNQEMESDVALNNLEERLKSLTGSQEMDPVVKPSSAPLPMNTKSSAVDDQSSTAPPCEPARQEMDLDVKPSSAPLLENTKPSVVASTAPLYKSAPLHETQDSMDVKPAAVEFKPKSKPKSKLSTNRERKPPTKEDILLRREQEVKRQNSFRQQTERRREERQRASAELSRNVLQPLNKQCTELENAIRNPSANHETLQHELSKLQRECRAASTFRKVDTSSVLSRCEVIQQHIKPMEIPVAAAKSSSAATKKKPPFQDKKKAPAKSKKKGHSKSKPAFTDISNTNNNGRRRRSGGKSKTSSKGSSISKPPSLSTTEATSLQQAVPQPLVGRKPSRPVKPLPQIDEKLDKALLTHTQSIHQIIEREQVYTLPRNALLEKELRTPATIKEIKSISSDNHWGTASCMVADRLGMKSHHFQEDNHTHKSLQDITQKTVAIRRLRQFIGSKISRVEHAKMILDVAFNYRSDYADGLPPKARALLNQGAPPNHRNSRFHQQNYATTKELKLMTKRERIHNNGCRPNSCCPLTMNCLIPMYMKELAGDKRLSKFQLTPDDLNQGDNYWFVLDNDDGSQSSFKRIITRQALEFCGCSYLEVILVSQYDLALKHELCLTVYGTPGMTLISSVYATDLKLFDMRMKDMNLYSAVCTLLMLYPHMENLVTERVIVMYDEEHLVKLDECLLYFLGPLLGIDKILPVISQWRGENMPPGAYKELRKIKLALLEKARAVLEETRRAYKAGEELTLKQMKTIAKLEKKYEADRDLWKRYKNGEVLPITEEVRINATLDALVRGRATMDKAREAVKNNTADDKQQDMVARQDEGGEKGRDTQDKAREAVKNGTADDDQQDMVARQQKGNTVTMPEAREAVKNNTTDDKQQDMVARQDEGLENARDTMDKSRKAVKNNTADDDQQDMVDRQQAGALVGLENGRDTQDKAREAVKDGTADDEQKDMVARQRSGAETKKMSNQVKQLEAAVKADKGVDVVKCNRNDSCGDLLYVEEDSCMNKDFPTAPPRGTIYRKQMTCSCCQHRAYVFEERLSKAETKRLYQEKKEQLEERTAATVQKKKERKKKRKSNSETEANEPKKKRKSKG